MELFYTPLPSQLKFHNSEARFRLYGGAAGGGKTKALRMETVRQCRSAPNFRALFMRRTFPELKRTIIDNLKQELPAGTYTYNASEKVMRFDNGSSITFGYCEYDHDVERYQGAEFDLIAMDELTHFTEFIFKSLLHPLRTTKKKVLPNFIAGTNPGNVGHVWVKRLWIDRDYEEFEKIEADEYAFFPARVYDNQHLLDNNIQYVWQLQSLPDKKRRALLEGDWDVFEGQYFDEFRREIHVVDPFIPRVVEQRAIALDYGYTAPSCVLWGARIAEDNYVIYRELYVTQHTYKQLAIKANAMTPAAEKTGVIFADPAMIKNEKESTTAEVVFAGRGIKLIPADNDRIGGWNIIQELLHPFIDPNTDKRRAKLTITKSCPNLIRTLPQMQHDKVKVEDIDTKGEDHAPDTGRYLMKQLFKGGTRMQSIQTYEHTAGRSAKHEEGENFLTKEF